MSETLLPPAKKGKATEVSGDIANILVSLRERFQLTQRAIADVLGVSFQQYQKYEKAKDRLSLEKAVRLVTYLGLSLDVFLTSGLVESATGFGETGQAAFGDAKPEAGSLQAQEQEWLQLLRMTPVADRQQLLDVTRSNLKKSAKS